MRVKFIIWKNCYTIILLMGIVVFRNLNENKIWVQGMIIQIFKFYFLFDASNGWAHFTFDRCKSLRFMFLVLNINTKMEYTNKIKQVKATYVVCQSNRTSWTQEQCSWKIFYWFKKDNCIWKNLKTVGILVYCWKMCKIGTSGKTNGKKP